MNPSLICVATVTDVVDNRFLVHFDNWDDTYDYWWVPGGSWHLPCPSSTSPACCPAEPWWHRGTGSAGGQTFALWGSARALQVMRSPQDSCHHLLWARPGTCLGGGTFCAAETEGCVCAHGQGSGPGGEVTWLRLVKAREQDQGPELLLALGLQPSDLLFARGCSSLAAARQPPAPLGSPAEQQLLSLLCPPGSCAQQEQPGCWGGHGLAPCSHQRVSAPWAALLQGLHPEHAHALLPPGCSASALALALAGPWLPRSLRLQQKSDFCRGSAGGADLGGGARGRPDAHSLCCLAVISCLSLPPVRAWLSLLGVTPAAHTSTQWDGVRSMANPSHLPKVSQRAGGHSLHWHVPVGQSPRVAWGAWGHRPHGSCLSACTGSFLQQDHIQQSLNCQGWKRPQSSGH